MMMEFLFTCIVTIVMALLSTYCHAEVKVYKQDGDLIIGGFVPLHFYDETSQQCSDRRDIGGLRRVEALAYGVDRINNDTSLLQNLTLGYEIYDTCSSSTETLKLALRFIPPVRGLDKDDVIGVVGPQRSSSSVQATKLLGLYNISSISYLSTSDELSNSDRYPYFLRTVPPDKFQVSVITDMLIKFKWKYVAFLYSDDSYGKNAEIEFGMQAAANDICIAYSRNIFLSAGSDVYNETVYDLLALKEDSLISVVILFVQLEMARNFFEHAHLAKIERDFIWIGSDGWGNYDLQPVDGYEPAALGAFTIIPKSGPHQEFNRYFSYLDSSSSSNPWFVEYTDDEITADTKPAYESIVIDSVEVLARGLENLKNEICDPMNKSTCIEKLIKNRRSLRDHLLNITFNSTSNGPVDFTDDGDSKGRYDIKNLVKYNDSIYFENIGNWLEAERLAIKSVKWYLKNETNPNTYTDGIPKSVCTDPCNPLEVMRLAPRGCCWSCDTCTENEIIENDQCVSCIFSENQTYKWPNKNLTRCEKLDTLKLIDEIGNVFLILIAILGITAEIVVAYFYIKNRDKRLIRASSRELSYIILVGILLSYISAILFAVPPIKSTCIMRRILPNIGTAFIYVSLLTMTVRIYRIFQTTTITKPSFTSPKTQVILTMIISLIPLIWGLIWIFIEPPVVDLLSPTKARQYIERICVVSVSHRIGQLVWDVSIVLSSCYFAILTRNLPSNYNQTRFIAFSVFCTLVVYIAFAPAFFTSQDTNQQDVYSALGNVIQPTVILIIIFAVRIYALYFVKEEDQNVVTRRRSMMGRDNPVSAPSVRNASIHVSNDSTPPKPAMSNVNNISTQTVEVEFSSEQIYKPMDASKRNTHRISSDSIEFHSEEEEEGEKEN